MWIWSIYGYPKEQTPVSDTVTSEGTCLAYLSHILISLLLWFSNIRFPTRKSIMNYPSHFAVLVCMPSQTNYNGETPHCVFLSRMCWGRKTSRLPTTTYLLHLCNKGNQKTYLWSLKLEKSALAYYSCLHAPSGLLLLEDENDAHCLPLACWSWKKKKE